MDEEGQRCLHSYLRFAHRKRAQQVREVEAAFDPATLASFGLEGAVFSAQDVHLILDNLKAEVTSMMQSELEHTYHTSGLMLQQLLRAGAESGAQLGRSVDIANLENQAMLTSIKNAEEEALKMSAGQMKMQRSAGLLAPVEGANPFSAQGTDTNEAEASRLQRQVVELQNRITEMTKLRDSLKEANAAQLRAQQVQQQNHLDEKTALDRRVRELEERLNAKERQYQEAVGRHHDDVSKLTDNLERLRTESNSRSETAGRDVDAKIESITREMLELRSANEQQELKIARLAAEVTSRSSELEEARRELEEQGATVSQSKQMVMMKRLMQQKSQQIVELKKRLAVFDTDIVSADADEAR